MDRTKFIGGSDMSRILENDWHSLWLEKTGREAPPDLSDVFPVQLGIHTEDFNLDWFLQETGFGHQHTLERNVPLTHPVHDYLRGTADGILNDGKVREIVECKHTNAFTNMNQCVQKYMPQVQFYMYLSGTQHAWLSVIFGNSGYHVSEIDRDDTYIEAMVTYAHKFWEHVVNDTEPEVGAPPICQADVDKIPVNKMTRRDGSQDNQFMDVAHTYIENRTHAQTHDNAKKSLKAMLGNEESEIYSDILCVRRDKRGAIRIVEIKETNDDR